MPSPSLGDSSLSSSSPRQSLPSPSPPSKTSLPSPPQSNGHPLSHPPPTTAVPPPPSSLPSPPSVSVPASPHSPPLDPRNLYVDNLPPLSDVDLRNLFLPYGQILRSRVAIDPTTHLPSGFGFVMFERGEDAGKAIEGLNGGVLGTKKLRVTIKKPKTQKTTPEGGGGGASAPPTVSPVSSDSLIGRSASTNLYVSGLPLSWTNAEVDSLFSPFGRIADSRILQDRATGKNRGIAMIRLESHAAAQAAIAALHGKWVGPGMQHPVTVKWANERVQPVMGVTGKVGGVRVLGAGEGRMNGMSPALSASSSPSPPPLPTRLSEVVTSDGIPFIRPTSLSPTPSTPSSSAPTTSAFSPPSRQRASPHANGFHHPTPAPSPSLFPSRSLPLSHAVSSPPLFPASAGGGYSQVNLSTLRQVQGSPLSYPSSLVSPHYPGLYSPYQPSSLDHLNSAHQMYIPMQSHLSSHPLHQHPHYTTAYPSSTATRPSLSVAPPHPHGMMGMYQPTPPPSTPPPTTPSLYCYGLPSSMTDTELLTLFSHYATVLSVHLMKNDNGTPKGYAFVNLRTMEDAHTAMTCLDGCSIGGRVLRVQFKKPGGGGNKGAGGQDNVGGARGGGGGQRRQGGG